MEYPPFNHYTGLTPRYLKILLNQFDRSNDNVALEALLDRWQDISLAENILYEILMLGRLLNDDERHEVDLKRFLAVACGLISSVKIYMIK